MLLVFILFNMFKDIIAILNSLDIHPHSIRLQVRATKMRGLTRPVIVNSQPIDSWINMDSGSIRRLGKFAQRPVQIKYGVAISIFSRVTCTCIGQHFVI